eukprot:CAMPEP_0174908886 /NCGR_PEP_ID=MMETSP0167-20121228/66146_1 /TAXON_ID=38298 /ORGANISM="Rhodella maculata, Strain CCMP736" /LENGTH=120 /DNA_ID=CAMNT_0016152735 /DNA_START=640 /DNA_END=1002 /DNA_ORIENTATION=-
MHQPRLATHHPAIPHNRPHEIRLQLRRRKPHGSLREVRHAAVPAGGVREGDNRAAVDVPVGRGMDRGEGELRAGEGRREGGDGDGEVAREAREMSVEGGEGSGGEGLGDETAGGGGESGG